MSKNDEWNNKKNSFTRIWFVIAFVLASVIGILGIFIEFKTAEVVMSYLGLLGTFIVSYVGRRAWQDAKEKKDEV